MGAMASDSVVVTCTGMGAVLGPGIGGLRRATMVLTTVVPGRIPRDGRDNAQEDEHHIGDRMSPDLIHRNAVETNIPIKRRSDRVPF